MFLVAIFLALLSFDGALKRHTSHSFYPILATLAPGTVQGAAVAKAPNVFNPRHVVRSPQWDELEDFSAASDSEDESATSRISGYKAAMYYVNWAIYARNYTAQQLPIQRLTHVNYAFADVNPSTGGVYLTDEWSDLEKTWTGDVATNGTNVFGNIKQLYLLKKRNRNLKTLLSIGGWTYSANFSQPTSTDEGRKNMSATAVQLLADTGFDGLDLDWEYPANATEANNMLLLVQEMRSALDKHAETVYAASNSTSTPHFLLTIAAPAGPQHYGILPLGDIAKHLDFIQLMAYDYSGSWDNTTGHSTNLYPSLKNPKSTPYSTDRAIRDFILKGVPAEKIMLGMPVYGRAFLNTQGPGTPFNGTGEGSWEAGVWDYKALPLAGCKVYYDSEAMASYCYNNSTRTLVSYDTPAMAHEKAKYIRRRNLGGAMWWESSADKTGKESLVSTVFNDFDAWGGLETTQNVLDYPTSKYDNLRNGMEGQ